MIGGPARGQGIMPFDLAQSAIVTACRPLAHASEIVGLPDAVGRLLARDIIAREDLVPFARSAMDGFAVCSSDVRRLPTELPVSGAAYAAPGAHHLTPGTASAIATGAALPFGADVVIPIEHVDIIGASIIISRPVNSGSCIFPPGDDARRGDVLLAGGTQLTPACIGLVAAAGIARVEVHLRPTVAIICGGDELVAIDDVPEHGQVRDSNGLMLAAAIAAAGGIALRPMLLIDTRAAVRDSLVAVFDFADLVVTTGGASVGDRDFVKSVCDELGVEFLFRAVGLRPAKPTAFGRNGKRFIAVLPGNPAAAFVAFQQFVRPAIRTLGGHAQALLPRVTATLAGTIHAKPGRHFAAFAALTIGRSGFVATPLDNQCSSLTRTAVDAAGFILVPPGPATYRDGACVDVDIFDWTRVMHPGVLSATTSSNVNYPALKAGACH